jgi:hypothetical protein
MMISQDFSQLDMMLWKVSSEAMQEHMISLDLSRGSVATDLVDLHGCNILDITSDCVSSAEVSRICG